MGLVTESGELMDAMKKHLIYREPLDLINLAEEIGDQLWYMAIICRKLNLSMGDIMDTNINKLKIRFPHKFTEYDALNRDLGGEREILEK